MIGRVSRATVHGAVSIVNAVATGKGSALGISLETIAEVELVRGKGIKFLSGKSDDVLIGSVVKSVLPSSIIDEYLIQVKVKSEIPIGFGLKSSSAVSNAVALACSRLANTSVDDFTVLNSAVQASLDAGVSITGAYDDACACYFGGFVVTENSKRKLLKREHAPEELRAVIFLPRHTRRGDVNRLELLSELFEIAFQIAKEGDYWKAMKLNGALLSAALSTKYEATLAAIMAGAISASISGNGPSTAAITNAADAEKIKSVLTSLDGRVLISKVNNVKASVELIDND